MYLADTDTLSYILRGRSPVLTSRWIRTPRGQRHTTSITLGELVYGARRRWGWGERVLQILAETLLSELPILPFDESAAHRYGELRAYLERLGTPIGDSDTRIAAIALVHGLTVITGNIRHFERVPGLSVENWLT